MIPYISSPSEPDAAEAEKALHEHDVPFLPTRTENHDQHNYQRRTGRPTAYLDGLRGVAALLIFTLHHQEWAHASDSSIIKLQRAYGWKDEYHFAALPGIRLLFTGGYIGVPVLFIISGYVLSHKPLQHIHAHRPAALSETISSALYRRWFRLYLPMIATTFIWLTTWHFLGICSSHPNSLPPLPTYTGEIARWLTMVVKLGFAPGFRDHVYNEYTWALPEEFRGSVVVYVALVALARHTVRSRMLWSVALVLYFLFLGSPCALFVFGMLMCEIEMLSSATAAFRGREWIWYVPLALGVYFGGVPSTSGTLEELSRTPGCGIMYALFPKAYRDFRTWYRFWSSVLITASAGRIGWMRRGLEMWFVQYLGALSFAIYLIHGPVLWSIGDRVYAGFGRGGRGSNGVEWWVDRFRIPGAGPVGLELNTVVPQLLLLGVTVAVADVVTRWIVVPSSKLTQWLLDCSLEPSE